MPTAKQLPSGTWRCRVFDHYEYTDGKKTAKYKSIISEIPGKKGKRDCERKAIEWSAKKRAARRDLLVKDAVDQYIEGRRNIISPTTLTAYRSIAKTGFGLLGHYQVDEVGDADIQQWINSLRLSPKTVRNKTSLLISALEAVTDETYKVTLPAKQKPDLYTPTDSEVAELIEWIKENPKGEDLLLCVMLAAFCSLRRSEACALTAEDIYDGFIHVNKALVMDDKKNYVLKGNKTYESCREIPCPDVIAEKAEGKKGRLIKANPNQISCSFRRAVRSCFSGDVNFRLHDLRSYYATVAYTLGIPEHIILRMGGWKSSYVPRSVYVRTQEDVYRREAGKLYDHFSGGKKV